MFRHVQCSCPTELFDLISGQYGEKEAFDYCTQMLHGKTQLALRINPQKVLREKLIEALDKKYRIIRFLILWNFNLFV